MSGILGVLRVDARASEADLAPMRDAMAFWGRDGEASWAHGGVALAHLLQTATRSRGAQAIASLPSADGVVVAADVRLDNRAQLSGLLGLEQGAVADEELVLRSYLRWGAGCAERLAGAFAFALWDGRRRRLVCARDHAGFRPFTYWEGPAGFVFATDARAVVACEGVPVREDEAAAVARFARNPAVLRERSLYAGVAKLPAGELIVVEPGRAGRRTRHWRPELGAPGGFGSPDECAAALRSTIALAAADAVDCAGPVGAHLSGGLDSSAVAAFAQQALGREGRSLERGFSWSPPAGPSTSEPPEHGRIDAVAEALGMPVGYTRLSEQDLRSEAARYAALEPNELLLYESRVLAEASRSGIGTLLSGWGGDEVASFNGRGQLTWLALRGRWPTLWREASMPARRGGGRVARSALRNIVRHALPPLLPDAVYEALRLGEHPNDRGLQRRGQGWEALHPLAAAQRRDMARRYRIRRSPRAMQLSILSLGHVENRIESWARAGAALGIDHRYPLLDRRVLELCFSLPGDVWLRDGWARWVFREAVSPLLPASVVWTREKVEPVRMDSLLGLLAGAQLDDVSAGAPLVRAHRQRQQELARMLTGGQPPR